jgi:hypothetical protein
VSVPYGYSIICDDDGNVVKIILGKLIENIGFEIGGVSRYRSSQSSSIIFSANNNLEGRIPWELASLESLEVIYMCK